MKRFLTLWFLLFSAPIFAAPSTIELLAGTAVPTTATLTWQQHANAMQTQWDSLRPRFDAIASWRASELDIDAPGCKTLLYPFSGPDFLNAYLLFPTCETYILFGLERLGTMPEFNKMSTNQTSQYLAAMRASMGDLLERNYFITSRMAVQLNTTTFRGVIPVIGTTMGALRLVIKNIELFSLNTAHGVKVTFVNPTTDKQQYLYYFAQDVTNDPLRSAPEFLSFITQDKRSYTLLKSASYLLHAPEFSTVRKAIVDTTWLLVQDDTGVPYKYLRDRWDVSFYGKYLKPIDAFNFRYQADLDEDYKAQVELTQPLPFPFGYHWKSDQSGLIVARKLRLIPMPR